METEINIDFLPKPNINVGKLSYISNTKDVYANLYEIKIKKELKMYKYPYSIISETEIDSSDMRIRDKLYKSCYRNLRPIYGECFFSGDSLYAVKKINEVKDVKCILYLKGRTEYTLQFQKCSNERVIKEEDVQKDPLTKQFIELIIKDILHSNPNLEFYKGLFVLTNKKKTIETERVKINFYPGFTTSFMETENGNYLNVTLKNKIIQGETILDYLKQYKYENNKKVQEEIKEELINRSFKVSYAKRNYIINDILFDRNPKNTSFNSDGKSTNLIDYYEKAYKVNIKPNQPLILVRRRGSEQEFVNLYFIPELCSLAGLEDDSTKDGKFMKELANYTKLEPFDRVKKTNEFLKLLTDDKRDPKYPDRLSAKEKYELYGIEVKPLNKLFKAYYMEEPELIAGNKKVITAKDRKFPVLKKADMTNWLCFYEKSNYKDAETLYNTLSSASKAFGLKIAEPEWVEMPNRATATDWTETADDYFGGKKRDYDFVIFLLDKNDRIYAQLKKHSLCKNGYVSQVVKARSLKGKGLMSVCSKILLQLNAKLRGISYKAMMDKSIQNLDLMIIGVNSSHIQRKRTGVAMVSSINDTFTDFYNKEDIIEEKNNKEQLQYCVSTFIEEAIEAYKKNNKNNKPKGIIIYRQGVSLQQKDFLKNEIWQIDQTCKTKGVLYYYILVNTKTTFKFFETEENKKSEIINYYNPYSGLLVIDGVTNRNFYEFYIQPQEVTQGSATPTCFHVAYGNLKFPELIPKLTFDLCHIYSNWQGTVRIPNVIKAAEKLSKVTAKYTLGKLNSELKYGQAYL